MGKPSSEKIKVMDGKILKVMLMYHMEERFDIKVGDVANELGFHIRTTSFRRRWTILKNEKHFIGPGKGGGLRLTSEGLKEAETPEYREMMKALSIRPKTNKEHQDRIKKYLRKPKSGIIFDFFLEYKSLSKAELAALVGMHPRTRGFSESLRELRDKKYVIQDSGNKFVLSDKCFVKGKENRSNGTVDRKKLAAEIAAGYARIEARKRGSSSSNEKMITEENAKARREATTIDVIEIDMSSDEDESGGF